MKSVKALAGVVCALTSIASVGAAATADPTLGATGYTYFNRPGAAAADYDHDLTDCIATSVAGFQEGRLGKEGKVETTATPLFYSGLIPDLQFSMANQARLQVSLQNCMTVAGWRVMRIEEAEGEALWKQSPLEIGRQLAAWVGAERPPGEMVRSYENDADRRGTVVFALRPLPQVFLRSLSLRAFDSSRLDVHPTKGLRLSDETSKSTARQLDLAAAQSVSPTEALVIFSSSGKSASKYDFFDVRRFGPSPDVHAWDVDGRHDEFFMFTGWRRPTLAEGDRKVYAVSLPPGRWRIFSRSTLQLCLGAPAFEARAGDVIYLGHFDLNAETLAPEMKLDGVPASLPLSIEQRARLRPADWTNGERWPCYPAVAIFAMEFPGFPGHHTDASAPASR